MDSATAAVGMYAVIFGIWPATLEYNHDGGLCSQPIKPCASAKHGQCSFVNAKSGQNLVTSAVTVWNSGSHSDLTFGLLCFDVFTIGRCDVSNWGRLLRLIGQPGAIAGPKG